MNTLTHLNPEEKVQLQKIWDAEYQTIVRGKDNGVPFLTYVFSLHYKIFGKTCSNCPSKLPGYIQKLKSLNTIKIMETKNNSNFKLKDGVIIPVPGTSKAYSNENLTDELAVELIAKNPKRKQLFVKLPKNVDELVAAAKDAVGAEKVVTFKVDNLVKIGDKNLTIEQATALLAKVGVETKATTVRGIETAIGKLSEDKMKELQALALDFKDDQQPGGAGPLRTKGDIEFDLLKAKQELEDLQDADPQDADAINLKQEEVNELQIEFDNAE